MIADDDLYWYRATYEKNHDGDTVSVAIDLGYSMSFRTDIRMFGINTPELMKPTMAAGQASQAFLERLLKSTVGTKNLRLKSYKDQNDKYGGRVLGELWMPIKYGKSPIPTSTADYLSAVYDQAGQWTNINQLMINAGLAKPYFGVGEKPV